MIYEIPDEDISCIKAITDSGQVWWLPIDPDNSDYQRYLSTTEEEKQAN